MKRLPLVLLALVAGSLITAGSSLGAVTRTAASPNNTSSPTIGGTARDGQTLTATSGAWGGSTPISYAYQWQSCNSSGSGCSAINKATNQNYVISHGDVNRSIRVQVTASNADGSNQALSAATATVMSASATAPVNTRQPDPSGTAKDGQTVKTSNGGWSGQNPITFTYQWQSCDDTGSTCSDIPGATAQSYTVSQAQVGSKLRATVTASNSVGNSSAFSNLTPTVVAKSSSPVNTSLPMISGALHIGNTVQASTGSWTGLTSNAFRYQWSRCNSNGSSCAGISGATGQSYGIGNVDFGNALRVAVTATNATGATSATSAFALVGANAVAIVAFNAVLRTGQELKAPRGTSFRTAGRFTAKLSGKTLRWTLTFSHLTGRATLTTMNKGARGTNGAAFKTLCRSCYSPRHGTLTLTSAQRDSLVRGRTYVNIRTLRNHLGELRGQIIPLA